MKKEELLQTLKHISDSYFDRKDYISAGMINRAMDVVNDYDGVLPQADVTKSVCPNICHKGMTRPSRDARCYQCGELW